MRSWSRSGRSQTMTLSRLLSMFHLLSHLFMSHGCKITFSYFKAILDTNQKKYVGDASSEAYTIPVSYLSADLWQAGVDALLTGNAST